MQTSNLTTLLAYKETQCAIEKIYNSLCADNNEIILI